MLLLWSLACYYSERKKHNSVAETHSCGFPPKSCLALITRELAASNVNNPRDLWLLCNRFMKNKLIVNDKSPSSFPPSWVATTNLLKTSLRTWCCLLCFCSVALPFNPQNCMCFCTLLITVLPWRFRCCISLPCALILEWKKNISFVLSYFRTYYGGEKSPIPALSSQNRGFLHSRWDCFITTRSQYHKMGWISGLFRKQTPFLLLIHAH